MNIRINKLLSEAGLGSRREVESLVTAGHVQINGRLAQLSDTVEEDDVVLLYGEELPVADLVRDIVAEQRYEQAAQGGRYRVGGLDYFDVDDEPVRPRQKKGGSFSSGGNKRKGGADGGHKVGKFRDYHDGEADRYRDHKKRESAQRGPKSAGKIRRHK